MHPILLNSKVYEFLIKLFLTEKKAYLLVINVYLDIKINHHVFFMKWITQKYSNELKYHNNCKRLQLLKYICSFMITDQDDVKFQNIFTNTQINIGMCKGKNMLIFLRYLFSVRKPWNWISVLINMLRIEVSFN